ncbi:uncharacterized protein LOC128164369 [Crassostrea angulata]|uniref:uncharacterized protein LOC128164369 n=1 Tax=Magallana angulata TaxID=2784310 RepID=UPI0022B13C28|nr:uncharacterized protein LOC128164369 [Crassostrea angulata]
MKFFGSLHEEQAKPLWEVEKESVGSAMHSCFLRCESDQHCFGIEICTIRPDLSRCRGCCEWYVVDKDGGFPINATDGCKYYEMSKDTVGSRGTRLYANSNMKAVASSTHMNEHPSYVLDELYGNECKTINVYSSVYEKKPWLEVIWTGTISIWRIIIYNRSQNQGHRLVNLNVTYSNNGVTGICGFYPGLLSRDGDIILFYCLPEAHATSVKLQIQSNPEQTNVLSLCEVEIYRKG